MGFPVGARGKESTCQCTLHSLLPGIVRTQGSNPGLWHCRWIFYRLGPGEAHCAFFWYYYYVSSTFRLSGFRSWRSGTPAVCMRPTVTLQGGPCLLK